MFIHCLQLRWYVYIPHGGNELTMKGSEQAQSPRDVDSLSRIEVVDSL